jgi:hypothetical protein
MSLRSPIVAMLWEIWRVTRVEAAWRLAFGVVGGLAVMAAFAAVAPADDVKRAEGIRNFGAVLAMILLVVPHLAGWLSMAKLNGGRPGFPLHLHYTRPVRTVVIVGLPMACLTAVSWAIYLVSALVLRGVSGHAFPLLPVAVWVAAFTLVGAATWSTRNQAVAVLVMLFAVVTGMDTAMHRLTDFPHGLRWYNSPKLWPTIFDFPLTDYAWIALIGIVSFGVTVAGVARQRRGEGWAEAPPAQRGGLWAWLINLFRVPCPTSSATRAQVWFDLKSNGLPVLMIGVVLALVILLLSAAGGPVDAAFQEEIRARLSCSNTDCFFARPMPVLLAPISLLLILFLAGNAFGIRRKQGRTCVSAFEATHARGTAHLAVLKVLVKSACVLAAIIAIGASAWVSMALLGDAVFIQMWNVPLGSLSSAVNGAIAALTVYEQLSLVALVVVGVVIWVAALAVLGALWTRYSRRMNIAASSLLLCALALALLALAQRKGMVSPLVVDAIFAAARWTFLAAMVLTIIYVFWNSFAAGVLTIGYASGAVAISAAFAAAWLTVLHMAGVQLGAMSAIDAASIFSPALLPLIFSALAPWSLGRVRHL